MERIKHIGEWLLATGRNAGRGIANEARQLVDLDRLKTAGSWRDRAAAVSWPRAGVVGGGLAALLVAGGALNWTLQPDIRAYAPRLPTEKEWRANQTAARAMEADLSPALAAANQSVTE